jgi:hypothetical protein
LMPGQQSRNVRMCFGSPANTAVLRRALETAEALMSQREDEDYMPVA